MKKILVLAAFVLSTTAMFAQQATGTFVLRPMAGLSLSSFGTDESMSIGSYDVYSVESKYKAGFVGGVELGYQVNEWLQPSLGVLYSQQGSEVELNSALTAGAKTKCKMDYLAVPVLANFYVWKGLALKIGVQPAFLLSAKSDGTDLKDDCNKFQLQIPVGISYEYMNFVLDARMNIPCTKAFKKDAVATTDSYVLKDARNNMFQLTLGYNFALN